MFQSIWGKFFILFNLKWAYLVPIVIFEIGSLICAASPNSTALIVGSAVSGVGSAGIFVGSFISIGSRSRSRSAQNTEDYLALCMELIRTAGRSWEELFHRLRNMAMVILHQSSTRWPRSHRYRPLFPSSGAAKPCSGQHPTENQDSKARYKWDLGVCHMHGMSAHCSGWFGVKNEGFSGRIVLLFFIFAISGMVWIYIQYGRGEDATQPGRRIKMVSIAAGAFASFCMDGTFFILLYYVAI